MRAELRAIDPEERSRRSRAATERLLSLHEIAGARTLLLFRALPTEIDTAGVLAYALSRGVAVFCPRIAEASLSFIRVSDETVWATGAFGVPEPVSGDALAASDVPRAVVVAPGLAFSERRERLGRGAGHYDRALATPPLADEAIAIGLGFDCQIVPELPVSPRDVSMDVVVTERRVIR